MNAKRSYIISFYPSISFRQHLKRNNKVINSVTRLTSATRGRKKGQNDEIGTRTKTVQKDFWMKVKAKAKKEPTHTHTHRQVSVWGINCSRTKISTKPNKSSLAELKYAFMHSCRVYLSSLFLLMLILTSAPRHKNIKASRGMDVSRKAVFYSALDE